MGFKQIKDVNELKRFLRNVLVYTGGKNKSNVKLYHYSNIDTIKSILDTRTIWLGSVNGMNDYLEKEIVKRFKKDKRLFFSSFSKIEENLAMYKMYSKDERGVMLSVSYDLASEIVEFAKESDGRFKAFIVRDNKITEEQINIDLYWTSVCYKDLHSNYIFYDGNENRNFIGVMNNDQFVGITKLFGWEYEREVRLCAETDKDLADNEKLAIRLPDIFFRRMEITTSPIFDINRNRENYTYLKTHDVRMNHSEYESFVDLGIIKEFSDRSVVDENSFMVINEILDWIDRISVLATKVSDNCENAILAYGNKRKEKTDHFISEFDVSISLMNDEYLNHKDTLYNKFKYIDDTNSIFIEFDDTIKSFLFDFREMGKKYFNKEITYESLKENNRIYQNFLKIKKGMTQTLGEYIKK